MTGQTTSCSWQPLAGDGARRLFELCFDVSAASPSPLLLRASRTREQAAESLAISWIVQSRGSDHATQHWSSSISTVASCYDNISRLSRRDDSGVSAVEANDVLQRMERSMVQEIDRIVARARGLFEVRFMAAEILQA